MDAEHGKGALFLLGGMYAATMYSSYMSSPWTIRNVGADEEHSHTAIILIGTSAIVGTGAAAIAAGVDHSAWPLYGSLFASATFLGVYWWALKGAKDRGYKGLNQGMSQNGGSGWGN